MAKAIKVDLTPEEDGALTDISQRTEVPKVRVVRRFIREGLARELAREAEKEA